MILATITGANLFTEPYLLTGGGGPDGASASPVLLMYQKGIEQGNPDVAAAIGVILVIGVLVDLAGQPPARWRGTDDGDTHVATAPTAVDGAQPAPAPPRRERRRTPVRLRRCSPSAPSLFLFPFYYMVDRLAAGRARHRRRRRVPDPGNLTLHNYAEINARDRPRRSRWSTPASSPAACILGTVVFGRARRLRPGAAAVPRPGRAVRGRCCWSRSCRSSC